MKKQHINKTILVVIILTFSSIVVLSQDKKAAPSMVKREAIPNTAILIDSARFNIERNPQKSFGYIEEALTNSLSYNDYHAEGLSYQVLGMINYQINQFDLAGNYYEKAILIFKRENKAQDLYQTYIEYSKSLAKSNKTEESIELLEKSLKYFEETGIKSKEAEIKNLLADMYSLSGKPDKALTLYKDVLDKEEQKQDTVNVIEVQQKIAEVYLNSNKNDEALSSYDQSVELARELDDKALLSNSLENKGKALRRTKKYNEELEVRKELLDISQSSSNIPAQTQTNLDIADIYMEMNNEEKAEEHILAGFELSERSGNLVQKGEALKKLSTVYDKKKDYNKALETYKNYVATVDKIHAQQKEEIQKSVDLYANLNRKLERLDMLEKDMELNRRSMDVMRQEQVLYDRELKVQRAVSYSLFVVLIALTIATFLMYRSAMNKRKANQLLALKSLRSQMNPHFIYNSLNSINNYIAKNNERAANKYLSSFSRLMRAVMDNSKHDFVPLSSELEILRLYLELENSRFPEKFDYKLEVKQNLDPDFYTIPPMLIQPFVENAIWHGLRYKEEKGYLHVVLDSEGDKLKIVIKDNGIGRKKSSELKTKYQKEHKSAGIKNIDNRLNIIHNVFKLKLDIKIEDLDNNTGEGTLVTILIPNSHNS